MPSALGAPCGGDASVTSLEPPRASRPMSSRGSDSDGGTSESNGVDPLRGPSSASLLGMTGAERPTFTARGDAGVAAIGDTGITPTGEGDAGVVPTAAGP